METHPLRIVRISYYLRDNKKNPLDVLRDLSEFRDNIIYVSNNDSNYMIIMYTFNIQKFKVQLEVITSLTKVHINIFEGDEGDNDHTKTLCYIQIIRDLGDRLKKLENIIISNNHKIDI